MIIKKLASKKGFTLTELLVTLVIVTLLSVAVSVGMSVAAKAQNAITMSSEASILSGTLAVELADELRFAENIAGMDDTFTFASRRFGANSSISSTDGRVTIGGKQILSETAYTGLNTNADVKFEGTSFNVEITITNAAGEALTSAAFSVTPLSL